MARQGENGGHWSSINFGSEIWNRLDPAIRESESLTAFKRGLSKAILLLLTFVYIFFLFKDYLQYILNSG